MFLLPVILDLKLIAVGYKEYIFIVNFLFHFMVIYESPSLKKKKTIG
jgi:hypothetical protein